MMYWYFPSYWCKVWENEKSLAMLNWERWILMVEFDGFRCAIVKFVVILRISFWDVLLVYLQSLFYKSKWCIWIQTSFAQVPFYKATA